VLAPAHVTVAASGKAATAAHGRQRDDRAQSNGARLSAGIAARSRPVPQSTRVQARFGRRFPRRAPPLWTPLPWHPLSLRNPQRGGALWLRGRSERRGRRRPLRLGGNSAGPRAPVRRPSRPAACIARVCWCPAGEGQASHFGRRRALWAPRLGASWRLGAPACALRLDGDLGQVLHLARLASRRLQGGSLRSPPAIVGPLPSNTWKTPPAIRPAARLARW
jgi:hypothetical protein